MTRHFRQAPILASAATAARLLDLPTAEFERLVDLGSLPRPRDLAGMKRWDVDELRRIATGEAIDEDFEP